MLKFSKEIAALANGAEVECFCKGWSDWMPLSEMRDSALRTFLGIENDSDWDFRIKKQ